MKLASPGAQDAPLVTAIVPAYNAARTVGATLSGLLNQTYSALEIIVVDDGSQDDTGAVVRAYGDAVRLIEQPNRGVSAARNEAIRQAADSLIAWNDADDAVFPRYIEKMVGAYLAAGSGRWIVTSDAFVLTPAGLTGRRLLPRHHPLPRQQRLRALQDTYVGAFSLYPRSLHEEIGWLDESLGHGEDRDLWLRAIFSGWQIVRQPEPQAMYRWVGGSSSAHPEAMAAGEERILSKLRESRGAALTGAELDYLDLRFTAGSPRVLISRADAALRAGDIEQASSYLTQAARLRPGDPRLRLRALTASCRPLGRLLAWRLSQQDKRLGWYSGMRT